MIFCKATTYENLTVESSALSVARATLTLQYYCSKDEDAPSSPTEAGALTSDGSETEAGFKLEYHPLGKQRFYRNCLNGFMGT